ncbi:Kae1-associated serine/threonine protein kinase [Candidatus Woesearchaeota archaeon]|nr:Kae1-associated serine/threonine protein kinase [Candidatus Woesearchaeota archaeon]
MIELAYGAEAIIYQDKDRIIKHRLKKTYRIKELDDELRKQRTRKEAKLLQKIPVPHPELIESDDKEKIVMQKIKGERLREVLDKKPILAKKVGELVAELHNHNIIHGDLTTSNIILDNKASVVFIDFGLSFHSHKIEDKAVDIHLFKQALNSKHHRIYHKALGEFLRGYKKVNKYKEILKRLEKVELRGRYRKT